MVLNEFCLLFFGLLGGGVQHAGNGIPGNGFANSNEPFHEPANASLYNAPLYNK